MTAFTATAPLDVLVRFGTGQVTVETCTDGAVSATCEALDPHDDAARALAEHARIDLAGSSLRVEVSGKGLRRASAAVHVRVRVPDGSSLMTQAGDLVLTTDGELKDVRVRMGNGEVRVPVATGSVDIKAGDCTAVVGAATSVSAVAGRCHLRVQKAGDVTVKVGHGQAELQSTSGRVVVKGGGVALDLREASGGEVLFETGAGSARVGVVEGTTVQLDLTSGMGEVRCDLPLEDGAPKGGADLRLRLRTGSGDVIVSRATVDVADRPALPKGRAPGPTG